MKDVGPRSWRAATSQTAPTSQHATGLPRSGTHSYQAIECVLTLLLPACRPGHVPSRTVSPGGRTDVRHADVNARARGSGSEVAHASSFRAAAARVVDRGDLAEPALFLASWSRSARFARISFRRGIRAGSTRRRGHRTQTFSCAHGVPTSRPQVRRATLRSSKWARNSSHSEAVRSLVWKLDGLDVKGRAAGLRCCVRLRLVVPLAWW